MHIDEYSDEELEQEIARRKTAATIVSIPIMFQTPDFQPLITICISYIQEIAKGEEGRTKDFDHYIYETAMECVYGKEVWDWINKHEHSC